MSVLKLVSCFNNLDFHSKYVGLRLSHDEYKVLSNIITKAVNLIKKTFNPDVMAVHSVALLISQDKWVFKYYYGVGGRLNQHQRNFVSLLLISFYTSHSLHPTKYLFVQIFKAGLWIFLCHSQLTCQCQYIVTREHMGSKI